MSQISLPRNGRPNLTFTGTLLAQVDEREFNGFQENWMESSLYKSVFGQYVLASDFHVTACGRRTVHTALVFASVQDFLEYLEIGEKPLSSIAAELLRQASFQDGAFNLCATFTPVGNMNKRQTVSAH